MTGGARGLTVSPIVPARVIKRDTEASDSQGNVTFTLGAPVGLIWQGSCTVTRVAGGTVIASAMWTALAGAVKIATALGPGLVAVPNVFDGEVLTVVGIGLDPDTEYLCTFVGVSVPPDKWVPNFPTPVPLSLSYTSLTANPAGSEAAFLAGQFDVGSSPPAQLPASQFIGGCVIKAWSSNKNFADGVLWLGDDTVTPGSGFPLDPGDFFGLPIRDLSILWCNGLDGHLTGSYMGA